MKLIKKLKEKLLSKLNKDFIFFALGIPLIVNSIFHGLIMLKVSNYLDIEILVRSGFALLIDWEFLCFFLFGPNKYESKLNEVHDNQRIINHKTKLYHWLRLIIFSLVLMFVTVKLL